jgi:hypothetical protein
MLFFFFLKDFVMISSNPSQFFVDVVKNPCESLLSAHISLAYFPDLVFL